MFYLKSNIFTVMVFSFFIANAAWAGSQKVEKQVVIDGASFGLEALFQPGSIENIPTGKFFGTTAKVYGYLWEGNTIPYCNPFDICGSDPSEYPGKLLGTLRWGLAINNPQFDPALNQLFSGNFNEYIVESEKISGVGVFKTTMSLNFSGSDNVNVLGADTLLLEGTIKWGVRGEVSNMTVVGGTGVYANAKNGTCKFERLIVVNAAGLESYRFTCPASVLVPKNGGK